MASTIFIWNNNMVFAKARPKGVKTVTDHEKKYGYFVVGHASIHIDSVWPGLHELGDMVYVDGQATYVSWWPTKTSKHPVKGMARGNLISDINAESSNVPDHIIRLPNLDETAMKAEWLKIRSKAEARYRFNVKNCSTIVARVLRAGSKWTDRNPWYAHSPLWTPLKVKRMAFSMGGTEMSWTALVAELLAAGSITAGQHTAYGLMKKRSKRHGNAGTAAKNENEWDKTHGLAHWYTRGP